MTSIVNEYKELISNHSDKIIPLISVNYNIFSWEYQYVFITHAAECGYLEVVELMYDLLENRENSYDIIDSACQGNSLEVVEFMIQSEPNCIEINEVAITAATFGSKDIVLAMLNKGATNYDSIIMCAERNNYPDIVKAVKE